MELSGSLNCMKYFVRSCCSVHVKPIHRVFLNEEVILQGGFPAAVTVSQFACGWTLVYKPQLGRSSSWVKNPTHPYLAARHFLLVLKKTRKSNGVILKILTPLPPPTWSVLNRICILAVSRCREPISSHLACRGGREAGHRLDATDVGRNPSGASALTVTRMRERRCHRWTKAGQLSWKASILGSGCILILCANPSSWRGQASESLAVSRSLRATTYWFSCFSRAFCFR